MAAEYSSVWLLPRVIVRPAETELAHGYFTAISMAAVAGAGAGAGVTATTLVTVTTLVTITLTTLVTVTMLVCAEVESEHANMVKMATSGIAMCFFI